MVDHRVERMDDVAMQQLTLIWSSSNQGSQIQTCGIMKPYEQQMEVSIASRLSH